MRLAATTSWQFSGTINGRWANDADVGDAAMRQQVRARREHGKKDFRTVLADRAEGERIEHGGVRLHRSQLSFRRSPWR